MKSDSIIARKSRAFALRIVKLYKYLKRRGEDVMSKQVLRSGTSIGANVSEGLFAQSREDFGTSKFLVEIPTAGPSADTLKLTALPSRFATETLRLRFGLKTGAIGSQVRLGWTTH